MCTHSCIQERVDFECVYIIREEDEVQMMKTLTRVLCGDEGKPRLEAIYTEKKRFELLLSLNKNNIESN